MRNKHGRELFSISSHDVLHWVVGLSILLVLLCIVDASFGTWRQVDAVVTGKHFQPGSVTHSNGSGRIGNETVSTTETTVTEPQYILFVDGSEYSGEVKATPQVFARAQVNQPIRVYMRYGRFTGWHWGTVAN